ncbi:MAG TPA: hypothetical protein VFQ72_01340 [Candidatus Paceibacterota bacterium]|nr:hypothetical protein [Candidatus Paceibacterota bacterium]
MDNQDNREASSVGYWVAGIIILIVVIGGIVLWRSNASDTAGTAARTGSTTVLPYGRTTVAVGQSASFDGITITPLTVAEDSRCAAGVQCVWAGTVRVAVRSDLAAGSSRQDVIALGSTTPIGTFAVSLVSVTPDKRAGVDIASNDYRFTFEVHQNGSGAAVPGAEPLEGKG